MQLKNFDRLQFCNPFTYRDLQHLSCKVHHVLISKKKTIRQAGVFGSFMALQNTLSLLHKQASLYISTRIVHPLIFGFEGSLSQTLLSRLRTDSQFGDTTIIAAKVTKTIQSRQSLSAVTPKLKFNIHTRIIQKLFLVQLFS